VNGQAEALRMLEALLFAAVEPLDEATLSGHLPEGADLTALLGDLQAAYSERGINVVRVAKRWAMRTAVDLAPLLQRDVEVGRRLSRAGVETLSIIAYHQPVTRAEIEEMRGVSTSRGTLDILLEAGWIKPRGRRQTPGRPVTWVTTDGFLDHFGLESLDDLPGVSDLRAAGLLDGGPAARPYGLELPLAGDGDVLAEDTEDDDPIEPLSDQPGG
jgi:segregation and condensation protein B